MILNAHKLFYGHNIVPLYEDVFWNYLDASVYKIDLVFFVECSKTKFYMVTAHILFFDKYRAMTWYQTSQWIFDSLSFLFKSEWDIYFLYSGLLHNFEILSTTRQGVGEFLFQNTLDYDKHVHLSLSFEKCVSILSLIH